MADAISTPWAGTTTNYPKPSPWPEALKTRVGQETTPKPKRTWTRGRLNGPVTDSCKRSVGSLTEGLLILTGSIPCCFRSGLRAAVVLGQRCRIGAQLGRRGEGKITDFLSRFGDVVVRYQGGVNAATPFRRLTTRSKTAPDSSGILLSRNDLWLIGSRAPWWTQGDACRARYACSPMASPLTG